MVLTQLVKSVEEAIVRERWCIVWRGERAVRSGEPSVKSREK
jgi:hypothetical protein